MSFIPNGTFAIHNNVTYLRGTFSQFSAYALIDCALLRDLDLSYGKLATMDFSLPDFINGSRIQSINLYGNEIASSDTAAMSYFSLNSQATLKSINLGKNSFASMALSTDGQGLTALEEIL